MKTLKALTFCVTILLSGCACRHTVEIDHLYAVKPQVASFVTHCVKMTPTYSMLLQRAKQPLITFEEESDGWVWINLNSVGRDFIHRWATLKVDPASGRVFKLVTDAKQDEAWTLEYDPKQSSSRPQGGS